MRAMPGILLSIVIAAGAAAQAPPPSGFPGVAPDGPEERILSFTIEPERIERGGTATLRWEGINAFSLTIEPGIGTVATRGSMEVAPSASTTYTLNVSGSGGTKSESVTLEVAGTSLVEASGPAATAQALPGLADGRIDLSGVWLGGRGVRLASAIELIPGAEGFRVPQSDEDLGLGALCLPPGVPNATMMPYPLQIVHKEDVLVILYEAYNLFRIVPIGTGHPEYLDPTWMGSSAAHWDGDTLVVDVVAFNDKTRISGHRHTQAMHVVERYTRTAFDTIEYEAMVEDPNVFAEPLIFTGNLELHPEWEIGEYVCAENNKDYAELFAD